MKIKCLALGLTNSCSVDIECQLIYPEQVAHSSTDLRVNFLEYISQYITISKHSNVWVHFLGGFGVHACYVHVDILPLEKVRTRIALSSILPVVFQMLHSPSFVPSIGPYHVSTL